MDRVRRDYKTFDLLPLIGKPLTYEVISVRRDKRGRFQKREVANGR